MVKKQFVKVIAYNCTDARTKAAKATEQIAMEFRALPPQRYAPIVLPQSPWELPEVTLCEVDGTGEPMPANEIATEDGRRLPIYSARESH